MSTTSSTGSRKLVIYPDDADLAPIKQAVMALGLPFKVAPFWFDVQASGDDRVLVLQDGFDWPLVCDWIYPKSEARLADAILWCLGEKELERGPHMYIDTMRQIFGDSVKLWESSPEEVEKVAVWP